MSEHVEKRVPPLVRAKAKLGRVMMTPEEVAAIFRREPEWFRRNRERFHAEYAFPAPLPIALVWDPAAISRWLDSLLPTGHLTPEEAAALKIDWNEELERRLERIAHGAFPAAGLHPWRRSA